MPTTALQHTPLALTWWGQAGVLVETAGARLVVDPFIAAQPGRTLPVPDPATLALAGIDAIAVTHEHEDHLHAASIRLVRERSPHAVLIVPAPLAAAAEALGGPVAAARVGEPITVGDVVVTPVPACHAVEVGQPYGDGSTATSPARFLGYLVAAGGHVVYHSGDTVRGPGHAALLRQAHVDLALLPINGRDAQREAAGIVGNLTAAEAVQLALDADIGTMVPIHWDAFAGNPGDPAQARAAAAGTGLRILELARYRRMDPTAMVDQLTS